MMGPYKYCDICHAKIPPGTNHFCSEDLVMPPPAAAPLPEVARLIPKGMLGTVDTVIDDLVDQRNDIEEIYVCIKRKGGTSDTFFKGSLGGLTFALLVLQDKALEHLNGT